MSTQGVARSLFNLHLQMNNHTARALASAQGAQGSKNPAIQSIASTGKEGDG